MSDMFWIARDLSNSKMGLITLLSSPVKKLTAFKNNVVTISGNTALCNKSAGLSPLWSALDLKTRGLVPCISFDRTQEVENADTNI